MDAQRRTLTLKRLLSMMLTLALIVTMVPLPFSSVAEAAGGAQYFIFPNEQYAPNSARVTNNERVTLEGTLNGVNGKDISYSVYQITMSGGQEVVVNSREQQTANIVINGSSLKIFNLQLYPGLNRVTFKGFQGNSEVYDSIYIEYRNGPTMYDMSVALDGYKYELKENETTVVFSDASKGKPTANISITGKAPNADKVQVTVNGRSWSFTVSSSNDWNFFASPITVNKGKNLVTIKAFNGTQSVETTREVAFYNDSVTFYDVHMLDNTGNKVDLSGYPTVSAGTNTTVYGKVIVPIPPNTTPTMPPSVGYKIDGVAGTISAPKIEKIDTKFMIMSFEIPNPAIPLDKRVNIELQSTNMATTPPMLETSTNFGVLLKDGTKPYILEGKYLPSYSSSMSSSEVLSLTGVKLDGAEIFSLPTALEFYVVNDPGGNEVTISKITDAFGKDVTSGFGLGARIASDTVVQNVNGVPTNLTRLVYKLEKLPTTGKLNIEFSMNGERYAATLTLLYGPFVKYEKAYDGIKIYTDTTLSPDVRLTQVMNTTLGNLEGQMFNIANENEIVYGGTGKTVFFYVNNTQVQIEEVAGKGKFNFVISDPAEQKKAFEALFSGDNKIKFVYRSKKEYYEKTITVTLIPTNLPEIPAKNTDGIFPYSVIYPEPKVNDPAFDKKGGIYYTKEAYMHVYGTFDFVDLGHSVGEATTKLSGMNADDTAKGYKLRIQSPVLKDDIVWSLQNNVTVIGNNQAPVEISGPSGAVTGIMVMYNQDSQTFSFHLKDVQLPIDGSPIVYNMTVFNSGEGGPRATYRLEVVPINVPFTILKPNIQKRILNQNFVEVIIHSPGADQVTINKVKAQKFKYDEGYDGQHVYDNAYKAFVTNLKPNRDTKIEIVITRGKDSYKSDITVKYVPTSIPGAQFMETMKNGHKVFDGQLSLTLTKGTNLIRRDYNVPTEFKTQVYTGNQFLFAIANPTDGVVDRRDFEYIPPNYDMEMQLSEIIFSRSFSNRFIKSSPVFWIDPGLADDIQTKNLYDPISVGSDPYQLPGAPVQMFYKRDPSRELVPSKVGKLTLAYDKNLSNDGGRMVTVFRFDPELQQWENIGGVVDEKKHTVTVPFDRFGYYTVGKLAYSYGDVVQHPYARDFIETVFAKGVMNAYEQESYFGTDLYVSRGEFARMIVRALAIPLNYQGQRHFDDANLPDDQMNQISASALWDFRYIETAAREGIVRGISPRQFGVDLNISRQDASVMIAKALNLKLDTDRAKVRKELLKYFQDVDKIDYYAQPSVLAIAKKGFISGLPIDSTDPKKGYVFQPEANMLRGDAALIMARVMISMKKLPKM